MKAIVVINETHSLMEEQETILNTKYSSWERYDIPSQGLDKRGLIKLSEELNKKNEEIVMLSPIPLLMKLVKEYKIFHNDNRTKKELPNGKIIMTVAQEGWELL